MQSSILIDRTLMWLLFVRAAAALLAFWVAGSCLAGDAVFSNDGQRVYAIGNAGNKQVLREINLTEQTSRTISLSQLPSQQPLLGITRSDGDKLFCVTEKNIWTFDPGSNRLTKVCGAPKGGRYWRIAYDPQSHTIVITGTGERGPLFYTRTGSSRFTCGVTMPLARLCSLPMAHSSTRRSAICGQVRLRITRAHTHSRLIVICPWPTSKQRTLRRLEWESPTSRR